MKWRPSLFLDAAQKQLPRCNTPARRRSPIFAPSAPLRDICVIAADNLSRRLPHGKPSCDNRFHYLD
jgi:hypothetical protein